MAGRPLSGESILPCSRIVSLLEADDNDREEMIMTWVMALAAVSFNIFAAKHLPLFEGVILFFNIIGFFAVCIPLWVLAPKAPSSEVWGKFYNGGGWSSTGVAAIVGILAPSGAFIGADSAAHMSVGVPVNLFTDLIQY